MNKLLHPAETRGSASYGWLQAKYSFSFANFFDKDRIQFGALRVLNDDIVAPSMGFSKHPHNNMEIITIPQRGTLKHKDSMGNNGIISAGEIQVMSAGSGVEHSEVNASTSEELAIFQIWIQTETLNVTPRYDQKKIAPLLQKNALTPVVKPKNMANENELWIHQQAYIHLGEFDEDTMLDFKSTNDNLGAYFFVIEGNVTLANETLNNRDALGLWNFNTTSLQVKAGSSLMVIEVPL